MQKISTKLRLKMRLKTMSNESPVAGALSRRRKNCNLWDYMNSTMILFKLCNNNKVLGHRFLGRYQIGPKTILQTFL